MLPCCRGWTRGHAAHRPLHPGPCLLPSNALTLTASRWPAAGCLTGEDTANELLQAEINADASQRVSAAALYADVSGWLGQAHTAAAAAGTAQNCILTEGTLCRDLHLAHLLYTSGNWLTSSWLSSDWVLV